MEFIKMNTREFLAATGNNHTHLWPQRGCIVNNIDQLKYISYVVLDLDNIALEEGRQGDWKVANAREFHRKIKTDGI